MMGAHPISVPCSRAGCETPATRYPQILIVAVGHSRGSPALRLVVPLAHCRPCQEHFEKGDFLTPENRRRLRTALMLRGMAQPDIDNAWVEWRRIGDRDWAAFCATPHDTLADSDGSDGA